MAQSKQSSPNRKHGHGSSVGRSTTVMDSEADTGGEARTLSLRENIRRLIDEGNFSEAQRISKARIGHDELTNIRGVCLMRMGKHEEALRTYRGLVLQSGSVLLRSGQPLIYQVNFATSLLLAGHPRGGADVLTELNRENHPRVMQLRQALKRWRAGLPVWHRVKWHLGLELPGQIELDFPPGELDSAEA